MNLLELVPRDLDILLNETKKVRSNYPEIDGFNIPDVIKLPIRSYEAVELLLENQFFAVPHIRSCDLPEEGTVDLLERLNSKGLTHVLIISGDAASNRTIHKVKPIDLVKKLKKRVPALKVFCGMDPYRQEFSKELIYCQKKIDAGADGLFTQPIFEEKWGQKILEELKNTEIFLGIAPVTAEKSKMYWEKVNNVTFPENFEFTLDYCGQVARKLMTLSKQFGQNTYHMPIKTNVFDYLRCIFPKD